MNINKQLDKERLSEVELTPKQYLELSKIRAVAMKSNKSYESIKIRKRMEFWADMGLRWVE